jgi:putative ABC transport system permease protein
MRVLLFTLGVSAVIALLLGALPALRAFRRDVQSPLKADGAATMGPGRLRIQRALVGVQVALAVLLLTGAGLVVRSFLQLQRVSPGFDMKQILTMRLTLPQHRYPGDRSGAFFIDLIARLERLPGVTSAAAASQLPPAAFLRTQFQIDGAEPAVQDTLPSALLTVASRTYFQTLRIPLVRGRWFDGDRQGSPPVALVNDVAARRFFGGADALGRRFRTERGGPWIEIVGVVGAVKNRGLEAPPEPEIYASLDQLPGAWNQLFVVMRTAVEPASLITPVRALVQSLDPDQPVYAVQTVEEAFATSTTPRRMATVALGLFALFALTLAATGVYGVVSYSVARRTQEIGIRMALGAGGGSIRSLVVRQALLPVGAGAIAGFAAALVLGQFLAGLLFEIGARDPMTLATVLATVMTSAAAASYLPARRASAVDPIVALRYD